MDSARFVFAQKAQSLFGPDSYFRKVCGRLLLLSECASLFQTAVNLARMADMQCSKLLKLLSLHERKQITNIYASVKQSKLS